MGTVCGSFTQASASSDKREQQLLVCQITLGVERQKKMSLSAFVVDVGVGDVTSVSHGHHDWMMCLFAP